MLQKFKSAIFLKQPHTVNLIMHNLHYKFVCICMVVNCIMLDRLFCLLQIELMMMIKASEWVYRSLSSTMNSWDFLSYVHLAKVWRAQKSSEMATKLQFLILKITSEFSFSEDWNLLSGKNLRMSQKGFMNSNPSKRHLRIFILLTQDSQYRFDLHLVDCLETFFTYRLKSIVN